MGGVGKAWARTQGAAQGCQLDTSGDLTRRDGDTGYTVKGGSQQTGWRYGDEAPGRLASDTELGLGSGVWNARKGPGLEVHQRAVSVKDPHRLQGGRGSARRSGTQPRQLQLQEAARPAPRLPWPEKPARPDQSRSRAGHAAPHPPTSRCRAGPQGPKQPAAVCQSQKKAWRRISEGTSHDSLGGRGPESHCCGPSL